MENFSYELTVHAQEQIAKREIPLEWVERVLTNPTLTEAHKSDSELSHANGAIAENGDRVLRVVYNHTTTPWRVVTVHFDRKMKGKL